MEPALVCSGPMSNISYDSHVVTRRRMADELPRIKQDNQPDRFVNLELYLVLSAPWTEYPLANSKITADCSSYTAHQMELEIQRVSRELFKAFSGMNAGFEEV